MLPGFRFLFAAIVLSMSILVFGLGAAALLRAAHEEFANLPSRRAPPEPMFARQNDDPMPTLALLRVDLPVAEKPPDDVRAAAVPEISPRYPGAGRDGSDESPAEPEKLAALSRQSRCRPTPPRRPRPRGDAGAARGRDRGPRCRCGSEARRHRGNAGTSGCQQPSPEPAPDMPSFEGNAATTRIATLGGPAVIVDERTSARKRSPDRSAVRKRAAQRARERRRIALARRARLAREATLTLQQQQPNPFAPAPATAPAPTPFSASRGNRWIEDQAGPVATGGPSAAPHSVHEPSYSAGFSTPRR